jgi:hypothetical protein
VVGRIGEDDPDEEAFLQDLWEEGEIHQAYKLLRLQQSPLVSLNAVAYALVYRRKGSCGWRPVSTPEISCRPQERAHAANDP